MTCAKAAAPLEIFHQSNTVNTDMILSGNAPIYESIANYFRNIIGAGALLSGDALPSVREIALAEGINPNTVVRAYGLLVDEGLVVSIPKKGYFVAGESKQGKERSIEKALLALTQAGCSIEDIENVLNQMKGAGHD